MYSPIKISEFLHRKKEPVKIDPNEEYSLVTVKLHHKGVVLREKKRGSLIGSNMYKVSKGQFILSGIDARNGAFGIVPDELDGAIVTNDFWYFDVDEKRVKRDFFYWLTNTPLFLDACQKSSKGETQRIRLQNNLFYDFEFHFPPVDKQVEFLNKINDVDSSLLLLRTEQEKQSSYIALLRQSILEEAIEGKLTTDWRKKHPELISGENHASKLLEKIRVEKERLIKEGKIKKEKTIAPITDAEKPFDIPKGWVFCKLVELIDYANNLDIHKKLSANTLINYVDIDSIDNKRHKIKEIKIKQVSELSSRARRVLKKGYVVYSTVRPYLENIAFVEKDMDYLIGSTGFIVFKTLIIDRRYIFNLLLSPYINKLYQKMMIGFNSPSITNEQFENSVVPLPPLTEQQAIIERVDKLMNMIDELEKQVTKRKNKSERLMQAVLREAFEK